MGAAGDTEEFCGPALVPELVARQKLAAPVHFSSLKYMAESPKHYRYHVLNPFQPNEAMRIGSAVHTNILGGDPYVTFSGKRQGKAWDAFMAEHADKLILPTSEKRKVDGVTEAIRNDRWAQEALAGCKFEEHIAWKFCGRDISSRVDFRRPGLVGELKVCQTAHPERFHRHMTKQSWHAQLAFYRTAIETALDVPASQGIFIAAEPTPPFAVTVFRVDEADMVRGERLCRTWMERLLQCEEADYWPAYAERPVELASPAWMDRDEEDEP